ncbi:hypothetical protein EDB81DRAFT_807710 [Dactylonectria macrodidyma]|uniref:Uncharacterized protein n=1 Tax=Dactylonectria macrodidyma TaxID=307937 RepID=A0A9P9IU20_9HYPO|nr:hypothetical protein EDB81DRAFT_807710 [Dactylonectria macrodidyma]
MTILPNFYDESLPPNRQQQAEADPFGTVTLWTYFHNCINYVSSSAVLEKRELDAIAQVDLVAAVFMIHAADGEKADILDHELFMKLLNRSVTREFDSVEGTDSWLKDETGTSALNTPSLLHILVAVAIKHYNYHLLVELTKFKLPSRNIFTVCPSTTIRYLDPSLPAKGWDALEQAGWIAAPQRPQNTATSELSAKHDYANPKNIGGTLSSCAKDLPSSHLRSYFCHIPRSLYTNIPPQPRWPGDPVLVKYAAARSGPEGLEVLRLLVEIGGMDLNDTTIWWKAGEHDPRAWNPLCEDGSECTETALHIAVDKGSVDVVHYLLTHGAKRQVDKHGRDQKQRAEMRGDAAMVEAFEQYPEWRDQKGESSSVQKFVDSCMQHFK